MSKSEVSPAGTVEATASKEPATENLGAENRASRRYNYPATQYIARYQEGRLPDKSMFRAVRCFDLSATGFSYLAPRPVERGKIVVALGSGLNYVYVTAEIVHCAPLGAGTALQYRVGCRFLERLEH